MAGPENRFAGLNQYLDGIRKLQKLLISEDIRMVESYMVQFILNRST